LLDGRPVLRIGHLHQSEKRKVGRRRLGPSLPPNAWSRRVTKTAGVQDLDSCQFRFVQVWRLRTDILRGPEPDPAAVLIWIDAHDPNGAILPIRERNCERGANLLVKC